MARLQFQMTHGLGRMLRSGCARGLSDQQLLDRFVTDRDEASFEVLVWRHGPTVLNVCRRMLRHEHDAEDAFQATFLILARKARSIGKRQAVGSWLHRVAYRVALRARSQGMARVGRETPMVTEPADASSLDPAWRDLRPVLDDEIDHLPAKYRAAFVLCYLAGKTNEQAARELGCPKGTVLSRLAWARQHLRKRLTQRGIGLSAVLMGGSLVVSADAACMPASLVHSTLAVVMSVTAGSAIEVAGSAYVASLTQGVLQAMFWTRMKIGLIALAVALALGTAGMTRSIWAARPVGDDHGVNEPTRVHSASPLPLSPTLAPMADDAEQKKAPKNTPRDPDTPKKEQAEKTYALEFREVPWRKVFEWYSDVSGLPIISAVMPTGTVTFVAPKDRRYTLGEITDILNELLLDQKLIILRRPKSFTLLSADELADPGRLPVVPVNDLKHYGNTELVTVVVPLTAVEAKDIAPEIRQLSGPFGRVVLLDKANQLMIHDTAANVRRMYQTLQTIEKRASEKKQ
jgi:RNA polymerase sigma factor (sigma-70 family)